MFCQIKSKNSSVYKPGIFSLARLKLLEKNNVFWREDVFWTEGPEWPPYVFGVFQSVRDAMVVEDARGDRKWSWFVFSEWCEKKKKMMSRTTVLEKTQQHRLKFWKKKLGRTKDSWQNIMSSTRKWINVSFPKINPHYVPRLSSHHRRHATKRQL